MAEAREPIEVVAIKRSGPADRLNITLEVSIDHRITARDSELGRLFSEATLRALRSMLPVDKTSGG